MKRVLLVALVMTGCARVEDSASAISGFHWHYDGRHETLVRTCDGTIALWGFDNGASYTVQALFNAADFTRQFLTRQDAVRYVDKHPEVLGQIVAPLQGCEASR